MARVNELRKIEVRFNEPQQGWWDGGPRDGGVFTPTFAFSNNPKLSYVKWGSWELNHWFNQPLHSKQGKAFTAVQIMNRALRFLRKEIRVPSKVRMVK